MTNLSAERVLLVNPGIYDRLDARLYPPWGILYVGQSLLRHGAHVRCIDLNGQDLATKLTAEIAEMKPTVVGLTGKIGRGARRLTEAIEIVHETSPPTSIAVGGPLVASFPNLGLDLWKHVDALFVGEGEDSICSWIADGKSSGRILMPPRSRGALSIPVWWEHLSDYVIPFNEWSVFGQDSLQLSATRGCTRRCHFCYLNAHQPAMSGPTFRGPLATDLVDGLWTVADKFGVTAFCFVDDCFVGDRMEFDDLVALLVRLGAPFRLGCDLTTDLLADRNLLEAMVRAGFRYLYVGVESGSASVRRALGKPEMTTKKLRRVIDDAHDLGLVVQASLGIGWPGETSREIDETFELLEALPSLLFDPFCYLATPGAPLTALGNSHCDPFYDYSEFHPDLAAGINDDLAGEWELLVGMSAQRFSRYVVRAEDVAAIT